jgi:hypothetical protein
MIFFDFCSELSSRIRPRIFSLDFFFEPPRTMMLTLTMMVMMIGKMIF